MQDRSFDQLHAEYRHRIHRYLIRLVGDPEAEDLTQEVFAKVGKALPSFAGNAHPSTWLFKIATNTAIDRLRALQHAKESTDSIAIESLAESGKDGNIWTRGRSISPDEQLIRREMSGCVQNIINQLPDNDRTVIILSELEGFTDQEIASILSIKTGAVKVRLHRARARLRKALESACDFYHTKDGILACDKKSSDPIPLGFPKRREPHV